MTDLPSHSPAREQDLNRALEALHFAFRALIRKPDADLATLGLTRVHHRLLYFIARQPGSCIGDIVRCMAFTKQYLHRPLAQLIEQNYVAVSRDEGDRRIKRLTLTARGLRLEEKLSGEQRRRFALVFREAGPSAEQGWHRVMALLADQRFD